MLYIMTGAFILFDLLTGLIKGLKAQKYSSTIMREGLFHKCGSVLCVVFGVLVDYAQTIVDLGVAVPFASAVCGYIILMEIGSIIENVGEINPEIVPEKLRGFFAKLSGKDE